MSERVCYECELPITEGEIITDACGKTYHSVSGFPRPCILALRAALERVTRERDEAWADNDRLRRDRADALNVKTRDGLTASEWIARTGKAERERDEAVEALRPFAYIAPLYSGYDTDQVLWSFTPAALRRHDVTAGDLRRAAEIVGKK